MAGSWVELKDRRTGVNLKVQGGTLGGSGSLCTSCAAACIIQGDNSRARVVVCGNLAGPNDRIHFDVKECSLYRHKNSPSLHDMRQQAWVLRTDESGQQIGFCPAKQLSKDEKHRYDYED